MRKVTLKPRIFGLNKVLILKFSQHNPYSNRVISKRKMVYKNSIETSFHLNSHFQNLKIFGFDFASPKILKSFRNINKFYISQVENLSEDKHMSMVFHSNITGLYSFILGRPTFWGPQTYILTTTGYCANFF